jgi:uncharacterized protein YlxW (UPF0749 family)
MTYPATERKSLKTTGLIALIFIMTGIFIGYLLTIQMKSSIPSTSYIYDELKAQNELIDSYIADQSLLKDKMLFLRGEIEKAQDNINSSLDGNNLETLKELKKEMGLDSVSGEGIEIILDDGELIDRANIETATQSLVNASDLRDIVNVLRTGKAKAIAINDQRVISSTAITSVGSTILVNNFNLLPPVRITAIGNPDLLLNRIKDTASLPDLQKRAKELKIKFSVSKEKGIVMPPYSGNPTVKYINEFTEL